MMRISARSVVLAFALVCLLLMASSSFAQEVAADSESVLSEQYRAVIEDVQLGISTGNMGLVAKHFASRIAVNLRGGESGTFSSNQAYYVLQDFFKTRRIGRFEFSTFGESDANPYAAGEAELMHKGTRERAQVYVALLFDGKKYLITQLTVY